MNTTEIGNASARRVAALLSVAVCAETTHSSLDSDSAKVDLWVHFRHAFDKNKVITAACQVKTGKSFKKNTVSSENPLKIDFGRDTIQALSRRPGPGLLVWVPPKPSPKAYWHIINPRGEEKNTTVIYRHQYITPYLRFALTRTNDYSHYHHGLVQHDVATLPEDKIQDQARKDYAKLKSRTWRHPLFGDLHVTRHGWRHVTRRAKSKSNRLTQLQIVPYLEYFLKAMPFRIENGNPAFSTAGNQVSETRHILCWYKKALRIDGDMHALLLRVRETVTYPKNWFSQPLAMDEVRQTATLESWWPKKNED